jgi:hypothetical protein
MAKIGLPVAPGAEECGHTDITARPTQHQQTDNMAVKAAKNPWWQFGK